MERIEESSSDYEAQSRLANKINEEEWIRNKLLLKDYVVLFIDK